MNNLITFPQLQRIDWHQGIVTLGRIQPEANFKKDLGYKLSDLLELASLLNKAYPILLTPEQVDDLTTVGEAVTLLNNLLQLRMMATYR